MPSYLVRSQLSDAADQDVRAAVERIADAAWQLRREGFRIRYIDTTYVPAEGWLGCRFDADNAVEVKLAVERAVLPFDDIVEAICLGVRADVNHGGRSTP